jgi:transcriptional regulator with XRE-family HTH domain
MARPTSRQKSLASIGVTLLRQHFNETMEEFAARMKVARNTVTRWENSQPPSGKTLKRLLALAKHHGVEYSVAAFEESLDQKSEEQFQKARAAQIASPENLDGVRLWFCTLYELLGFGEELDPDENPWASPHGVFVNIADHLFAGGFEELLTIVKDRRLAACRRPKMNKK